ncbi:PREDICTED: voltage-dependent calcium channel subunit alpha-2/delta-3-like [Nicrophorus vespilloides]|uniref:Voltage-dependent calcium channel subunit alpha-2/delta-3-like n=1 Tax=Nicrophorus vespilloides TaxID=110193 RepID=A0ABM1NC05_NICVS|nr:PREDICTED: voltage-dependent calcium channel subunit alpha-2/delta-3-like [Nicrophorus vespilloides]
MLKLFLFLIICSFSHEQTTRLEINEITDTVTNWVENFGNELQVLMQLTRKNQVKNSFSHVDVVEENWDLIIENVSQNLRDMMNEKVEAVKAIKHHAELLAFHRKPDVNMYSLYDFYDANDVDVENPVEDRSSDIHESEKMWECGIPPNPSGLCFSKDFHADEEFQADVNGYESFNYKPKMEKQVYESTNRERCSNIMFLHRPKKYYSRMNVAYNPQFDTKVNLNYSIVRVSPGVYSRERKVLNGIRWSEGLDLTFKCNYNRDPTLTWQFFGSPDGFMRFYPAMKWSEEEYDQTYDFRIRSWYIEGISSAKDIIILLDRSGSMKGNKRVISTQIVNAILDTLTDNDYVNIYTFTNRTESLVDCFNDTLVQANEENLRLLREQLLVIKDEFYGDITHGLEKAFPILWKYREARRGAIVCNQAIMLITEGLDYEYKDVLFNIYNHIPSDEKYRPIRFFTYLLGTDENDAQRMKWIACENMGYYVNITVIEEVRERVLKYLEVMSRPINMNADEEMEPAWSALYVHLVDRRLSNWLWKRNEGNRQRDIFIKYEKQQIKEKRKIFEPTQRHFTLEIEHPYEKYRKVREYKYLTSVSLPVYDKRANKTTLLGVAGVDVPLDYIKQLTEPHRIGVNGYAFIITNNGYVLHHPDHRREFKDRILKPTFNRVDFTEVEISDATVKPRIFDDAIIELRENVVLQKKGRRELRVRTPVDDMKRVILSSRHYFYTKIGPFSLVIALPDRYGFLVIRHPKSDPSVKMILKMLSSNKNWRVHPKWLYTCKTHRAHKNPEQELLYFLERKKIPKNCDTSLIEALLKDVNVTEWFNEEDISVKRRSKFHSGVVLTFMATHAGLTRWKNLMNIEEDETHFANTNNKAPDEVYYRRAAELNYDRPDMFLFSVPLDPDNFDENSTLITVSNVVYQEKHNKKAPVAAVGLQILHKTLNNLMNSLQCNSKFCKMRCGDDNWRCYVLDNDGYVVLDNDTNNVGKLIADVDSILTDYLVRDGVYKDVTVFDYQGTCYPNYYSIEEFYGPTAEDIRKDIKCRTPIKCKTIEYLRRQLQKTIPTPCDIELKLYNSLWKDHSRLTPTKSRLECSCAYIAQHIRGTNLMMVVVNGTCCPYESHFKNVNEFPREIQYNLTLPCYIATMNNFTKRHYTKCIIKNKHEYTLNQRNHSNCGYEGIVPRE